MAYTIQSPNTGTSLKNQSPNSQRKLWQKGVDVFEQSTDFFTPMEGKSASSIIQTETDTSKGQGQEITFTTMAGLYDEPHEGEELFETQNDFEELLIGDYKLVVDYLRHGVRFTERSEELMGLRGELKAGIPIELGKWLGRIKTERLFMMFIHKTNPENLVYANGKTLHTLSSADTLSWDEIVAGGTRLEPMGGTPAYVGRTSGGQKIYAGCVVATTDALFSLEMDPSYKAILRETSSAPHAKYIFDGGYTPVRGHIIKKYNPIDHDGHGAWGSPLNAKASLGEAITAGTGVFDIKGGGSAAAAAKTKIKYFKFFPGYAYRFNVDDVLAPPSETRYVLIINPPNAPVDPNKIGMYSYTTGNNGNKITIVNRLGPSAGGARVTTLGAVTWNTGPWAGKHTDVHPVGALVLPCNEKGVPFGETHMLYARAAYRGYGKWRNRRSEQLHEGGFVKDVFVTSVFGQTPRRDVQGRCPGILRIRHALQLAGLPLPVIP
jgi:hypothetical protein